MSQQPQWNQPVPAFHQQLTSFSRRCRFCGSENRPDAKFCNNCGAKLTPAQQFQLQQSHPAEQKQIQLDKHQLQQKKPRLTWKQIGAAIGGVAAIIGIITGGMAILRSFQNSIDRFEGDITQQATADSFVSFANNHDGKVIWLNITCVSTTCFVPGETQETILPVQATSGKYWFHIDTAGTDAQANNGQYGAGALVVKGYFEVSVRGVLGAYPQDVQNIYLKGVDSSTVNKG